MEIDLYSPNCFPSLLEVYQDSIITPYKNMRETFGILKTMYQLEQVDFEDTVVNKRAFGVENRYPKESCEVYLLKRNIESETFYKYHMERFIDETNIFLLVETSENRLICTNELFELHTTILRGVNKADVEGFSQRLKNYLMSCYLFDNAMKKIKD